MDKSIIERRKIGFLFLSSYDTWSGGIIYILNIIRALNFLDDDKKPEIELFHGYESPLEDIYAIKYPYIKFYQVNSSSRIKTFYHRAKRIITGTSAFIKILPKVVYPYNKYIFLGKAPIHWIPDFQEWHLPQMFSKEEVDRRKQVQASIASSGSIVVFSSQDAMNDFNTFFPKNNCELRLLHFASILPEYKHLDISGLRKKYDISGTYFMSPNQFWKHKNHKVILEAITLLKESDLNFQVAFTGSQSDYRNKDYFQSLLDYIEKHKIQRWIKFLGFIDRADQLSLMYHAQAIIQPSLFEGWSTVVEDTKAMSQFIILSDIGVHKEQVTDNCCFFDPHSASDLASIIRQNVVQAPPKKNIDYSVNIKNFSDTILEVINL